MEISGRQGAKLPKAGLAAIRLAGATMALVLALAVGARERVHGEEVSPFDSVFELFTYTKEGKGVARGTAFFIDPSGLALTNSHVVYRAQRDPEHYALIAIVGKEFYGVEIVCASPLDVDPFKVSKGPVARDIAEIRLTIPSVEFSTWGILPGGGSGIFARAHVGPLPAFPVLTLAGAPQEQGQIRVIGYGRTSQPTEKVITTGKVTRASMARDGTPVFEILSDERPERGSSGSPVLDDQNRVVGMYTWNDLQNAASGIAISSVALSRACP